ncbi:MAG TPA: hypothetical protein DCS63_01650 [Elusimicrobia bacterium]|nr:hypothetical protein [Elusimicrobiota bacterium]
MFRLSAKLIVAGSLLLLLGNIRMAPMRRIQHEATDTVRREDMVMSVRCSGTLAAKNISVVRAAVSAHVLKKYVAEGARVKKGQLLIELDPADIDKMLRASEEEQQSAAREYVKAKKEVKVQKDLFKYGAVAKKSVEDSVAALEKAEATTRNASKALQDMKKSIGKTRIRAPMNGLIIRDYLQGENTVQQDKEIFMVGTLDAFQADVGVDEMDVARVTLGQKVELQVEAFPDTVLAGKVLSIAPAAERTNFAKVNVKIEIRGAKGLGLKPNLSVDARIITGRLPDVLTIPVRAVSRHDGETWVLSVGPLGRTLRKRVGLGDGNDDRVVALSGVREGEALLLAQ